MLSRRISGSPDIPPSAWLPRSSLPHPHPLPPPTLAVALANRTTHHATTHPHSPRPLHPPRPHAPYTHQAAPPITPTRPPTPHIHHALHAPHPPRPYNPTSTRPDTETLTSLEKFVCQVYGDKKCDSVNELRHKKLVSKERKKRKSPSSSKHQAHEKNLTDFYKKMKKKVTPLLCPLAMPHSSNRPSEAT